MIGVLFCLIGCDSKPTFTPLKGLITPESLGMKFDSTTLSQAEELSKSKNYSLNFYKNPDLVNTLIKRSTPQTSKQMDSVINRVSNGRVGYINISEKETIIFVFDNDLKLVIFLGIYTTNKEKQIIEHESELGSIIIPSTSEEKQTNKRTIIRIDRSVVKVNASDKSTTYAIFAPSITQLIATS